MACVWRATPSSSTRLSAASCLTANDICLGSGGSGGPESESTGNNQGDGEAHAGEGSEDVWWVENAELFNIGEDWRVVACFILYFRAALGCSVY